MKHDDTSPEMTRAVLERAFERKVQKSRWSGLLERLWPRLWLLATVLTAFALVSTFGVWPHLGDVAHWALLAAFALALIAALVFVMRTPWPTREEAVRRIERVSGVAHRPASSYDDTLSMASGDSATRQLWRAHRERLAHAMQKLKVGAPKPHTHRFDPFALRSLLVLGAVLLTTLAGRELPNALRDAFRFSDQRVLAAARLDAWLTPPGYTGKAPIMLADGARDAAAGPLPAALGALQVPTKSILIVRSSGARNLDPVLEVQTLGRETPEVVTASPPANSANTQAAATTSGDTITELRYELTRSARVRVLALGSQMAAWTFDVTPDLTPEISLTKPPERSARGALKLTYKVKDDYGVASAQARVVKVAPKASDEEKTVGAWASKKLEGPRPPHERPPVLALKLPRTGATEAETFTHLEFGTHPWAGLKVKMWLEAKDVAGQTGRSDEIEILLPQRRFDNPIARAVIEQRRKLVEDPRHRRDVLTALDALTTQPEGFLDNIPAYLGLRSAYHRLKRSNARAERTSVIEQLWHVALRLEDGDLSEAERRLREAQEKLSKALEQGASDQEIAEAMKELREALNEYMRELAEQNQERQDQFVDGQNKDQQFLSSQDLDRMMKNIEDMAKNGSREQAQQMLSELRDLLDRLQSSKQAEANQQRSREMMEKMDQLGNLVGKQQQLMDETFGQMRKDGERGEQGQRGQQRPGQQGQQGQQRRNQQQQGQQPGRQGQRGQQGQQRQRGQQGQQGERGEQGQQGQGEQGERGQGPAEQGGLGDRQRALRGELDALQRGLDGLGMGKSDQLDQARKSMENAEKSLGEEDFATATEEQARALDQMRQGAQQMAKQMLQNMPQRYGQNGDTPRDPLGRPQRSQGPDLGTSVKVPDEIDRQRAREILEELRRRIGEQTRPTNELDYIERLLRRF